MSEKRTPLPTFFYGFEFPPGRANEFSECEKEQGDRQLFRTLGGGGAAISDGAESECEFQILALLRGPEIVEELGTIDDLRGKGRFGALRVRRSFVGDLGKKAHGGRGVRSRDHNLSSRATPLREFRWALKVSRAVEILRETGRGVIGIRGVRPSCVSWDSPWGEGRKTDKTTQETEQVERQSALPSIRTG